jgi:hypothetical protein
MNEVMERTGFIETIAPMIQTAAKTLGTRLVINEHVYHFKESTDPWSDAELDRLIERGVLPKKTPLRGRGRFVCEVLIAEDYEAILSISAGYRPYDPPTSTRRDPPLPSAIPNTRETPVSATKKQPQKGKRGGKKAPTTSRPGRAPDTPAPAYSGPDPAAG